MTRCGVFFGGDNMAVFEFSVTSGIGFGNGTLVGTMSLGGPAFTFSFNAALGSGSGNDIVIQGIAFSSSTATAWSGTFAFTDASDFFSNFQLNGAATGATALVVNTALGATSVPVMFGSPFVGNVVSFTISGSGGLANILDSITSNAIQCFCAGTRIATAGGPVAVENLTPGTGIMLADGTTAPLRWLGRQSVAPRYLHPARINPVCITAGALGQGLPERDLYVSGDHGVVLDGLLINAMALVNGRTIYQVEKMPLDGFTYYHVELDTHAVLLAEGCASESYLDMPSRETFDNGAERAGAPIIQEMDMLRISSRRLLPQAIRERLNRQVPDFRLSA